MAIHAPSETLIALGPHAAACDSRSLFQSRFADPTAKDNTNPTRKAWFETLIKKKAENRTSRNWFPVSTEVLYARLMSRLMVDLASGVMQNANLNLDRYGLPRIPGSAVKGCARRMALQALRDWIGAGTPSPTQDDACAPCSNDFATPADMLAMIARIFGWVKTDWDTGKKDGFWKSDFAWAANGSEEILGTARAILPKYENFGGTIAFLEASPNRDPGLELDVVTPHHTKYHQGDPGYKTAPDTEDPVPVFFPAVKPQNEGDYFSFPLIPLRLALANDLAHAKRWLANGLELFGIGAKTAAGYGWFDASDVVQKTVRDKIDRSLKAAEEGRQREAEETKRRDQEEAARLKREQEAAATANLSPDEKEDWKLAQLNHDKFEAKVRNFFKEPKKGGPSDTEKPAIIRALRGPRLEAWAALKSRAAKGGDPAKAEQAIRTLNKQLNGDKMP